MAASLIEIQLENFNLKIENDLLKKILYFENNSKERAEILRGVLDCHG